MELGTEQGSPNSRIDLESFLVLYYTISRSRSSRGMEYREQWRDGVQGAVEERSMVLPD